MGLSAGSGVAIGSGDVIGLMKSAIRDNNLMVFFEEQIRAANLRSGKRILSGAQGFATPWGCMAPAHHFRMFVRRYMHKYRATSRHFGWVAVTLREHASRNPRALRRDPITIDDHQNSRMVVDPLLDGLAVGLFGAANYRGLAAVSVGTLSYRTAVISEEVVRSAYFCSMSNRLASWGPRARSPTQSAATTVLKL